MGSNHHHHLPSPTASSYATPPLDGGYQGDYLPQSQFFRAVCIDARGGTPIVRAAPLYVQSQLQVPRSCDPADLAEVVTSDAPPPP